MVCSQRIDGDRGIRGSRRPRGGPRVSAVAGVRRLGAALLLLVPAGSLPLLAQEDPFGTPSAPAASNPFGAPAAPAATAPDGTGVDVQALLAEQETNPVVLALEDKNPQTPRELTEAVQILLNLGRPDVARKYLERIEQAEWDAATLVDLHTRFGSRLFLRLIRHAGLQPDAAQFGNRVLDAAYRAARDPDHLQSLLAKLEDRDPAVRHTAVVDLKRAGDAGAAAVLSVLADPGESGRHPLLIDVLVELGETNVPLMLSAMSGGSPVVRANLMEALGRLRAAEAIPMLVRPAVDTGVDARVQRAARGALGRMVRRLPDTASGGRYLARRTRQLLDEALHGEELQHERTGVVWRWDAAQRVLTPVSVDRRTARLDGAAQVARELYALVPDDPEHGRLYLAAELEAAKAAGGADQPLRPGHPAYRAALETGIESLRDLLDFCLRHDYLQAAAAVAEILGATGDVRLLDSSGGYSSRLVDAARHSDRRLRYAATMAVFRLDPVRPYAGASHVLESLAGFVRTAGTRRVLIAHHRLDRAQTLVGMLAELGFEADTAATGEAAFRLARQHMDYEFILLGDAVGTPPVSELIQQMRQDPRAGKLPIGLMARQENAARMERLAEPDRLTQTFPRPHDTYGLAIQTRRLLDAGRLIRVPVEQRYLQARAALHVFARLARYPDRYPFYDLLRHQEALEQAVYYPPLLPEASTVLAHLATPTAQRALLTVASQHARPIEHRRSAAAAFDDTIGRRGLLLTSGEILRQYDLYNGSENLDVETQQVLGALLDSIEEPTKGPPPGESQASQ